MSRRIASLLNGLADRLLYRVVARGRVIYGEGDYADLPVRWEPSPTLRSGDTLRSSNGEYVVLRPRF